MKTRVNDEINLHGMCEIESEWAVVTLTEHIHGLRVDVRPNEKRKKPEVNIEAENAYSGAVIKVTKKQGEKRQA